MTRSLCAADLRLLFTLLFALQLGCPSVEPSEASLLDQGVGTDTTVADDANVTDTGNDVTDMAVADTPDPSLAALVVSEFQPGRCGLSEWVEVTNVSRDVIDLRGYSIGNAGGQRHVIEPGDAFLVDPNAAVVLGETDDEMTTAGIVVDYVYSGFSLGDAGDQILINDPDGALVDAVVYDETWWPEGACGTAQLSADRLDGGANDDPLSWCLTPGAEDATGPATPGADNFVCGSDFCGDRVTGETEQCDDGVDNSDTTPNACRTDCTPPRCGDAVRDDEEGCDDGIEGSSTCTSACVDESEPPAATGEIVITEVLYAPAAGNRGDFVELYNAGEQALNLGDCVLTNSAGSFTFPGPRFRVEPGDYLILGGSDELAGNGGLEPNLVFGNDLSLAAADVLTLTCGELDLDRVSYDSGAGWPGGSQASMQLTAAHLDAVLNDDLRYWCTSVDAFGDEIHLGSPGRENAVCVDRVIDRCRFVRPVLSTILVDEPVTLFTSVIEAGVTDQSDGIDSLEELAIQVGYGPDSSEPSESTWTWVDATGSMGWSNDGGIDQYQGSVAPDETGEFDTAGRASRDAGQTWTYCDLDTGEAGYQVENAGTLIVNARDDISAQITDSEDLDEPAQIDSVHGSEDFIRVFDFIIADGGGSDGLPTRVTQIQIHVASVADIKEHEWQLNGPDVDEVAPTITDNIVDQILTFEVDIEIDHEGLETYTLGLRLAATSNTTRDGDVLEISLSHDGVTLGEGTSLAAEGGADNAPGIRYDVDATGLRIVTQPGESETVGVGFDLVVHYVDANDNLDVDVVGDVVFVVRRLPDEGQITQAASLGADGGIASFTGLNQVVLGKPGNLTNSLTLSLQDDDTSTVLLNPTAMTTAFTLIDRDDADARLLAGDVLSEPGRINSTSSGSPVEVLDFTISDGGTSDGLPVRIRAIHVQNTGTADAAEHEWRLRLPGGTLVAGEVSGTEGAQAISFNNLNVEVADAMQDTFTLTLSMLNRPDFTDDGESFVLNIGLENLAVEAGTSFAPSSPVGNGGLVYDVDATRIAILTQPSATELVNEPILVVVGFVDDNMNIDRDVRDDVITVTSRSDGQAVVRGTSSPAFAGVAEFATTTAILLGAPGNRSGTLRLTLEDDAGLFDFSGSPIQTTPFHLVNADDADATVSATTFTPPTTIQSIDDSARRMLEFRITDGGTSDDKATIVERITVRAVSGTADARDHTWTLTGLDLTDPVEGTATGSVGDQIIVFDALPVSVAHGGNEIYTLNLLLAPSPTNTVDGALFNLSLDAVDLSTHADGTSLLGGNLDNGDGMTYLVEATELSIITQPGATQEVAIPFYLQVGFTDANGNIDTAVANDVVFVTRRSDGNPVTQGVSAPADAGVATFSDANRVVLGSPGNVSETLTLFLRDDSAAENPSGSADFSGAEVETNTFNLVDENDGDATIVAGPTGEIAEISSLAAGTVDVLDFNIVDGGLSDGLETVVLGLTVRVTGEADASEHDWYLDGPDLGGAVLGTVSGMLGAQVISFSGLGIRVAHNSSETYTLSLDLDPNPAATQDEQSFQLSITGDDASLGAGTSMRTNSPVTNGSGLVYSVVATSLRLVGTPAPTQVVGQGFDLGVDYVDANGNLDRGVDGDVLTATRSDAGAVTQGLSAAAVDGTSVFAGLNAVVLGQPGRLGNSLTLNFTDDAAGVDLGSLTTASFNLVALDDNDSQLLVGPGFEPSSVDSVDEADASFLVFDFIISDSGVSDGKPTDVIELVFRVAGTGVGGTADVADYTWTITGTGTSGAAISVGGFRGDQAIMVTGLTTSVPNGTPQTFTLRAQLPQNPSGTRDSDSFAVTLVAADVTTDPSGSSVASGTAGNDGVTYLVDRTEIRLVDAGQFDSDISVDAPIELTVHYTDIYGNIDASVAGDFVSAIRTDGETVTSGTSAAVVAGTALFTGANAVRLGSPGNADNTLRLELRDNGAGSINLGGGPILTPTFRLVDDDDNDAELAAGGGVEPSTVHSVDDAAVARTVLDFELRDGGTSDGLSLDVTTIVVDVSGSGDAKDHLWTLSGPGAPDLVGDVQGIAGSGQTITFSALTTSVADGDTGVFMLTLQLAVNPPNTQDGDTFSVTVSTANITSTGTSFSVPTGVANMVEYQVTATEMRFVQQPPANVQVDTPFPMPYVSVEYTDASGNRDLDVSGDVLTAARNNGGNTNQGSSNAASAGLATFSSLELGTPGDTSNDLRLVISTTIGGLADITSNAFTLSNSNDGDALLQVAASGEPTEIQSINGAVTPVLDFEIHDGGTSDGLPAAVTTVVVQVTGTGDASDHVWTLNGPGVVSVVGAAAGDVGSQTLTFSGLSISVANSGTEEYTLRVQLAAAPAGTVDGHVFGLQVRSQDLGLGGGTTFTSSSVANSGLEYKVVATALAVSQQPPNPAFIDEGFDLTVEFVDANGNRDRDVTSDIVSITQRSDSGTIVSGQSSATSQGVAQFTAGTAIVLGTPENTEGTLFLTLGEDGAGVGIDLMGATVNTTQFALRNPIDRDAVLAAGPFGEPAEIDKNVVGTAITDLFDFQVTDGGSGDGQPVNITDVVVHHTGTADAADHVWTINGLGAADVIGTVAGTVGDQTITFTGLSIAVPDNTTEVYTVRVQLGATPAATVHNDTFVFAISTTDITLDAVDLGTEFAVTTTVNNLPGTIYKDFALQMSSTDALCNGSGTATATVLGGQSPVTITWSPVPGSGSLLTNLIPGTYTATATDGGGDEIVASVDVVIGTCATACPFTVCTSGTPLGVACGTDADCGIGSCGDNRGVGSFTECGTVYWPGQYLSGGQSFIVNVVAGESYNFNTCGDPSAPNNEFDTTMTIFDEATGDLLMYNDDVPAGDCAFSSTQSGVEFISPITGQIRIAIYDYPCDLRQASKDNAILRMSYACP